MASRRPSAQVALLTYGAAGRVDWTFGACLAVGGMANATFGVAWAQRLPERRMHRIFAGILLATALWLAF